MKQRFFLMLGCFILVGILPAENEIVKELKEIPIEMVVLKPAELQSVNIWVPAVKSGPFINRSCRAQQNLASSSELSATINHQKETNCPAQPARILAELTSGLYEKELPLTIFNGWQWEYSYSLCQYENASYTLSERGGSWEDCHEAILNMTIGEIALSWLKASTSQLELLEQANTKSTIYIHTFSSMRTRDGYPKERKL